MTLKSLKKFKPKLSIVLKLALLFCIAAELFVLYRYGYLSVAVEPQAPAETPRQILDIRSYMNHRAFVEEKNSYQIPEYSLVGEAAGRDNPLAEY